MRSGETKRWGEQLPHRFPNQAVRAGAPLPSPDGGQPKGGEGVPGWVECCLWSGETKEKPERKTSGGSAEEGEPVWLEAISERVQADRSSVPDQFQT